MSDSAYQTEEFEIEGHTFKASFFYDYCMGAPWEEHYGHGPVREVRSLDEKRPGEIVMHDNRGNYWLYDVQAATATARKEWGLNDEAHALLAAQLGREPTHGEIAARAVEHDIAHLRGFLRDDWHWTFVTVSVLDDEGEESSEHTDTCGGFESSDEYCLEWAKDQAAYMVTVINKEAAENSIGLNVTY
jgi:hypothetical protein